MSKRVGRKRKNNKHLPPRMYFKHGAYYLFEKGGRWIRLSDDFVQAMTEYAKLVDTNRRVVKMSDVIDKYRVEVTPGKEASHQNENTQLSRFVDVFGHMRPDEITPQHIYQYMEMRSDFPGAANHEVTLLHHLFKKAIRWGAGTQNPAIGIEKNKRPPRDRYVSDEEFEAVRELAIPSVRVAMDIARLTGLRRGDILALTRDNLTDDGLLVMTSKTGAGLLFEYTDGLRETIKAAQALKPQVPGHHLVRNRSGKSYSKSGFSANWQRLMRKAVDGGVERFQFRDLRAKNASDSDSIQEASDRLGHASTDITKRVYYRKAMPVKPIK